jgi:hypothetical protein
MKTLKFNIAENKRVDGLKFLLFSAVVLVISLIFIFGGMQNLLGGRQTRQKDLKELDRLKGKLEEISVKSREYEQTIKEIKSEWDKRVKLANSLIARKKFSYIKILTRLEESLPAGVYITRFSCSSENKGKVSITIMSDSFPRLIEAYKSFAKFNLEVSNETEVKGLYRANMLLKMDKQK